MATLTICPHCGEPLPRSDHDLRPKDPRDPTSDRLIGRPEVEIDVPACTLGRSAEGSFDRRLTGLGKPGLIERQNGRVWATDAGRILARMQP